MKLAYGTIHVHPGGLRVQMHTTAGFDEVRYDEATTEALADAARVLAGWLELPSETPKTDDPQDLFEIRTHPDAS